MCGVVSPDCDLIGGAGMEVPTRVAIRINSSGPTASGAGDASQVLPLDSEARIQALHALRQWRKLDGGLMVNEAHLRHEDRPFANQAGRRPCDGNTAVFISAGLRGLYRGGLST